MRISFPLWSHFEVQKEWTLLIHDLIQVISRIWKRTLYNSCTINRGIGY
jgi:hypothetical protein